MMDDDRMKPTTTEQVFELLDSYTTAAVLGAAMELGLFWLLADKPLEVEDVAKALSIPLNRCRYWLGILVSAGLVEQVEGEYAPSEIARTSILDAYSQETWAFLAGEAQDRFPVVSQLARYISEPGSVWAVQGSTPPDYFTQLVTCPERARRFTCMLYELHLSLANGLVEILDISGVARLLDLGGGSGVMSLALLQRYPHLTAVVVDIANVCAAGRKIAAAHPDADRITYHAADFLHEDLPEEFDLVLECDVGIYDEALFDKILAALRLRGRLVIVDQFALASGVAPPSRLHWAFLGSLKSPNFAFPTAAEIETKLIHAGFQVRSQTKLPEHDVPRWTDGWTMITAYKS